MSSSPSSLLHIVAPTTTSDEISLLHTPQNPNPIASFITPTEEIVAAVTTNPSPLFPILSEISPPSFLAESLTVPSPPISSVDVDTPSTSHNTDSPSSFSFALNTPTGDDIPSPILSWSSPLSPASISQEMDMVLSSPVLQMETLPPSSTTSLFTLMNILPSLGAPVSSSLSLTDHALSSPPSSPPSFVSREWRVLHQEELLPWLESMDQFL